jgi:hypothetical protein
MTTSRIVMPRGRVSMNITTLATLARSGHKPAHILNVPKCQAKLHGGVLRATPNGSNDDRQYHGDLSEDHACDIRSGRSAKVEKHLSAPLGMKNRFAQRGQRIGCRDGHLDRAGSDERYGFT